MMTGIIRIVAAAAVIGCPLEAAFAQTTYSHPQLRLVRQIAVATYLSELCGARLSQKAVNAALRSEGLREQDMVGQTALRDEVGKQRIAVRDSNRELQAASGMSDAQLLRRNCDSLERNYGPRGVARPGLAILPSR
jgi:hypothetical protein